MAYNKTYAKNLTVLKKCEKIYKWVFIIYAAVCIPYIIASLILIVLTVSGDVLWLFADGIIFKLLIFTFGFMSCYKKSNLFACLVPAASFFNILICGGDAKYLQSFLFFIDDFNVIILIFSIVAATLTTFTNKKYHLLEQCEGFPYFNELLEASTNICDSGNDIYKEQYEKLKSRHKSDTMDDI